MTTMNPFLELFAVVGIWLAVPAAFLIALALFQMFRRRLPRTGKIVGDGIVLIFIALLGVDVVATLFGHSENCGDEQWSLGGMHCDAP
jgi:hypothetical protein